MKYERGAEWRRWDLHLHTPGTKKNDNFTGENLEEKWDNFYKTVHEYVGNGEDPIKNVVAVGITDYLSIDNYKKVVRDNKLPESIKLILPNVEMRIIPVASRSPVNIHFIFDPEIADELETRFFAKLLFDSGDRDFSASKVDLIALGRSIKQNLTEEAAYKRGIEQFIPTIESIKNVFKDTVLREKTLIGISNSTPDGVSGVGKSLFDFDSTGGEEQLKTVKDTLFKMADFIFSSKPSDIDYFLGKKADSEAIVKRDKGSLKPCIHGSDAHSLEQIFNPDEKRYCWIKANPTFNGLRQIIYEPEARVRISTLKPETKTDYHVIDYVQIVNEDFSRGPIYFNDKLNCIIGGKSTGKSLLLHNLARTIDKKQVEQKTETTHSSTREIEGMTVYWVDGTVCESGQTDNNHKIVYIPQTYLNKLSDENEEITEIDHIIQDIVLMDDDCKQAYEQMNVKIQEYKPVLDKKIYDLLEKNNKIHEKNSQKKELGTRGGIQKEIEKLKNQKKEMSKEFSVLDEDLQQYEDAMKGCIEAELEWENIQEQKDYLLRMDKVVSCVDIKKGLLGDFYSDIETAITEIMDQANEMWLFKRNDILCKMFEQEERMSIDLVEKRKTLDILNQRIKTNEAIEQLTKIIRAEEEKLAQFESLENECIKLEEEYNALRDDIAKIFGVFEACHKGYADVVNSKSKGMSHELDFSVKAIFKKEAFWNFIRRTFDKRVLRNKKDIVNIDDFDAEDFNSAKLSVLIDACVQYELPTIGGVSVENALRTMLSDWYITSYDVKMDNDSIDEMSPGKKALVLLKLLINLADSTCPILIDQPEDDLDNRSIFDELIPFIKEKKLARQIIVVTHNANIVLGADAEEVIIANQRGNNSPNKEHRFEYRSGAIEDNMPIIDESGQIVSGILNEKGVQQHICDILEGGEIAFDLRKHKYRI